MLKLLKYNASLMTVPAQYHSFSAFPMFLYVISLWPSDSRNLRLLD